VGRELVTPPFENLKGVRGVTQDKVLRDAKIAVNKICLFATYSMNGVYIYVTSKQSSPSSTMHNQIHKW
jgi:hypothetical protein